MKTTLFIITAATIVTILVIGIKLVDFSKVGGIAALVIGSQTNQQYASCIQKFSNKKINTFEVSPVKLNQDSNPDAIVQFTTKPECGTAGCIVELCVYESPNEFKYVPFSFAAKTVTVSDGITNKMHDLILNDDPHLTMSFNGDSYVLSDTQN